MIASTTLGPTPTDEYFLFTFKLFKYTMFHRRIVNSPYKNGKETLRQSKYLGTQLFLFESPRQQSN